MPITMRTRHFLTRINLLILHKQLFNLFEPKYLFHLVSWKLWDYAQQWFNTNYSTELFWMGIWQNLNVKLKKCAAIEWFNKQTNKQKTVDSRMLKIEFHVGSRCFIFVHFSRCIPQNVPIQLFFLKNHMKLCIVVGYKGPFHYQAIVPLIEKALQ